MRKKKWRRSFWPTFLIILVLYQHCLLYPANCDLLKHCCTFGEIHPSLRNPGSFIRKDFSAKTEKIFLGRKLVKAVISSEDNQTMGNFHREAKSRFSRGIKVGKNRPTSIYLESSNRRIREKRFQWGVCSESRMWSVEEKLGSKKLHFLFKSCTDYRQKPWQLETYQYTHAVCDDVLGLLWGGTPSHLNTFLL